MRNWRSYNMTRISTDNILSNSDLLKAREKKQMEKMAQDFEAHFITSMLKDLDKTAHFTKKSYREETTMAIMYEKLGDFLAKKGIGVKEMIQRYAERGEYTKVSSETGDNKIKQNQEVLNEDTE